MVRFSGPLLLLALRILPSGFKIIPPALRAEIWMIPLEGNSQAEKENIVTVNWGFSHENRNSQQQPLCET